MEPRGSKKRIIKRESRAPRRRPRACACWTPQSTRVSSTTPERRNSSESSGARDVRRRTAATTPAPCDPSPRLNARAQTSPARLRSRNHSSRTVNSRSRRRWSRVTRVGPSREHQTASRGDTDVTRDRARVTRELARARFPPRSSEPASVQLECCQSVSKRDAHDRDDSFATCRLCFPDNAVPIRERKPLFSLVMHDVRHVTHDHPEDEIALAACHA
jgi:hypothetical protein